MDATQDHERLNLLSNARLVCRCGKKARSGRIKPSRAFAVATSVCGAWFRSFSIRLPDSICAYRLIIFPPIAHVRLVNLPALPVPPTCTCLPEHGNDVVSMSVRLGWRCWPWRTRTRTAGGTSTSRTSSESRPPPPAARRSGGRGGNRPTRNRPLMISRRVA